MAAGINLYMYNNIFPHSDVAFFHWQSMKDLQVLRSDPGTFFNDWLFNWGDISGRLNLLDRANTPYWNNLGSQFHGKFMTLCNMLSFGHIYVNILFYNLVFFTGQIMLYRTFYEFQPHKKWLFLFGVFLVPSVLFWCSGIHKDGWILTALGFICFYTIRLQKHFSAKALVILLLAFLLLFIVRYYYFFCLFPAFVFWILSHRRKNKLAFFAAGYAVLLLIFFTMGQFFPDLEPMNIIVHKQQEFMTLEGLSKFYLPELRPTFLSFVQNFPFAVQHILFWPNFNLQNPVRFNLASIDSLLIAYLLVLTLIYLKRKNANQSYYFFALFFSVSVYLFIGYTIPNSGALVRYKSEFTAMLIPTMLALSEIPWLKRFYRA